ncbi:hypothetical protein ACJX0J_015405, partial [Zea mays]
LKLDHYISVSLTRLSTEVITIVVRKLVTLLKTGTDMTHDPNDTTCTILHELMEEIREAAYFGLRTGLHPRKLLAFYFQNVLNPIDFI